MVCVCFLMVLTDGVDILIQVARTCNFETTRVQTGVMYVLRNLSDMLINDPEFKEKNLDDLLEFLVNLLGKESHKPGTLDPMVLCAAGILSNLTCNNVQNKMKVCHLGGIQLLLQVCHRYPNKEEVTEPAMCTLRHITGRHPECDKMRVMVERFGGLPLIAKMLCQQNHWTLIKAIVGLIQNLSAVAHNRGPLRELRVIDRIVELMFQACQLINQVSAS